jgi:hypothetical protein
MYKMDIYVYTILVCSMQNAANNADGWSFTWSFSKEDQGWSGIVPP